MQCPACKRLLTPATFDGTTLDVCELGCGGVWFDQGELGRFADPLEAVGEGFAVLPADAGLQVDMSARRRCPKCPDSVLMRHFFSARRAVTIDECPTCAGVWLDRGELAQIRHEFTSVAERQQAASAMSEAALIDDRMALGRSQIGAEPPSDSKWSRIPSAVLVVVYVAVAGRTSGVMEATRMGVGCLLPLACIWWPDALGSYVGLRITRTSPRSWVWFFGWFVLLLPSLLWIAW